MQVGNDGKIAAVGAEIVVPFLTPTLDQPLRGLTVLLVEDSRFASEAVRLLCLRSGARLRRADCLRAAARHLRTYRPDVMIVDMGLPDGDGASLIRQANHTQPRIPVLLGLSGENDRESEAMSAGADGFLAKPIDGLALFQQVILGRLPAGMRPDGLRLLPDEAVHPDPKALREDLSALIDMLVPGMVVTARKHAVQCLTSLSQLTGLSVLADAADDLANSDDDRAIRRVRSLIQAGLADRILM